MTVKVFSKRHPESSKNVYLRPAVRQRILYLMEEADPYYYEEYPRDWDICREGLAHRLKAEHGWTELRAYPTREEWEEVNTPNFILRGMARFVMDATEIFHDLLVEDQRQKRESEANSIEYQEKLNVIFEEANCPWRMLDGRIVRLDSKWVEAEVDAKARELLCVCGFDGALHEFQQARSDLSSGDTKGAIHAANLALESTIKSILAVEHGKPGALIRKLIDSALVPDYHEGFLKAFEEHILRSVANARNFEKGVGHGQGTSVSDPPKSLAELGVNLAGVLILYLMKRHIELNPPRKAADSQEKPETEDDIPF